MAGLKVIDRGREEYSATLTLQENLLANKVADATLPDYLVLVEHDEVFTVGRGVEFQKPVLPGNKEVNWIEIARGGEATFHGPGQLVAYPIFELTAHGKDVHLYLRKLEQALILALSQFEIEAFAREGLTGVWVKNSAGFSKKIASLGVGVRKWVSYHGLALNVLTDLTYFRAISPCGQDGEVMTSLQEILTERGVSVPEMESVKHAVVSAIASVFSLEVEAGLDRKLTRPKWLKAKAPNSPHFDETREVVKGLGLVTVCEEAHCPNIGECWSHHTATFMIMGELCTRRCSFCAVKDGTLSDLSPLDPMEPVKVGAAIAKLKLRHVVITSVNRDDLEDMGAEHFNRTVRAIAHQNPGCAIELLIPDMAGKRESLETVLQSGFVTVLNHNLETVPRLYRRVRPGANFKRSLNILRWARELYPSVKTKSGLMLGLGESREEVLGVMDELRKADVNILTLGQYLQPTDKQLPIHRWVTPEEFLDYKNEGLKRGFSFVESGPLVRSSYHAWQHSTGGAPYEGESQTSINL